MVRKTTKDALVWELIKSYEVEIRKGIEGIEGLPGVWGVWLTPGRLQIGLLDDDGRIDRHCIEVCFGRDVLMGKEVWEANIGSRGAFDLTPGSGRLTFYIGAGLILGSHYVQQELKERLNGDFMSAYTEIINQNR